MQKLKGKIKVETDEAILIEITEDMEGFHLDHQTEWFPKSQIKMNKKVIDGERIIRIPNWIYDDKIRIDPRTL